MSPDSFDSTPRLKPSQPKKQPKPKPAPGSMAHLLSHKPWDDSGADGQAPKDSYPHWAVWNKHRPWSPRFRHPSEESARSEAFRLASLNKGRRYYVVRVESFIVHE